MGNTSDTRNLPEGSATDTGGKVRGYVFEEQGPATEVLIRRLGEKTGIVAQRGYFEIDADDYQALDFNTLGIERMQISVKSNSGLFLVTRINLIEQAMLDTVKVTSTPLIKRW